MGERLRELRRSKGLSQEKLEERSGISRATISAIENDPDYNTTTKTLARLAEALGSTVEELLYPKCNIGNTAC